MYAHIHAHTYTHLSGCEKVPLNTELYIDTSIPMYICIFFSGNVNMDPMHVCSR